MSPPPIAVVFRLFALLPGDAGGYAWWGCQLVALAASLLMLARARPLLTAAAMLVLLFPTVYEIGVGNVNSFLLLGLLLIWRLATTGREGAAGAIGAVMTAIKLTPGITLWWLLVTGRLRAFGAAVATGIVVLLVSIAGAGLQPHLDYLGFLTNRGVIGTSPLSLGGMARYVGVPANVADLLPTLAIAIGLLLVLVFRRPPGHLLRDRRGDHDLRLAGREHQLVRPALRAAGAGRVADGAGLVRGPVNRAHADTADDPRLDARLTIARM